MSTIWVSDIHLNFLDREQRVKFYETLKGSLVLITGDIAESHNVEELLTEMSEHTGEQICFVLGNHDYYGSSIKNVRTKMEKYINDIFYLSNANVQIDDQTILVGVDGWGDGRNGDYENSSLTMSDWLYIEELNKAYLKGSTKLLKALQKIADGDAAKLAKSVIEALTDPLVTKIIIATHVPPFAEASRHAGKKSTPCGLPFFSSQILGVTLLPIIEANPHVQFLWLSGHTHARVTVQKRPNLVVKVADAQYYFPQIEELI